MTRRALVIEAPGSIRLEERAELEEARLRLEPGQLHVVRDGRNRVGHNDEPDGARGVAWLDRVGQAVTKPGDRVDPRERDRRERATLEEHAHERELRLDLVGAGR